MGPQRGPGWMQVGLTGRLPTLHRRAMALACAVMIGFAGGRPPEVVVAGGVGFGRLLGSARRHDRFCWWAAPRSGGGRRRRIWPATRVGAPSWQPGGGQLVGNCRGAGADGTGHLPSVARRTAARWRPAGRKLPRRGSGRHRPSTVGRPQDGSPVGEAGPARRARARPAGGGIGGAAPVLGGTGGGGGSGAAGSGAAGGRRDRRSSTRTRRHRRGRRGVPVRPPKCCRRPLGEQLAPSGSAPSRDIAAYP